MKTKLKTSNSLLGLFLLVSVSCTNSGEKQGLEKSINNLQDQSTSNMIYVVLEQSGCSTCLYKADEFFESYRNHENLMFVLMRRDSGKSGIVVLV